MYNDARKKLIRNYNVDDTGFIAKELFKDGLTARGNKIVKINGKKIIYSKMGQGRKNWVVIPGYILEKVSEKFFRVELIRTLEEKKNILKVLKQKHLKYKDVHFWTPSWDEDENENYNDYDYSECLDRLN